MHFSDPECSQFLHLICKSHLTYKFYLHTHVIYIVLKETEVIALKRSNEGFNEINFTTGVLNCFLIVYIVGAYPQHLWLLYFIESFYMVSTITGTLLIYLLYIPFGFIVIVHHDLILYLHIIYALIA